MAEGVKASLFHAVYEGTAPWDVGHAQPEVVRLANEGAFVGEVLDVGCGQGDNAIELASRDLSVTAVDFVDRALEIARDRAHRAGVRVEFRAHDALRLEGLGRTFDTVLDSAFFHVLGDEDRPRYVESLTRVLRPGGVLHLLCFSDEEPGEFGPRRVREDELRGAFADGWRFEALVRTRFAHRAHGAGAHAWLATLRREPAR